MYVCMYFINRTKFILVTVTSHILYTVRHQVVRKGLDCLRSWPVIAYSLYLHTTTLCLLEPVSLVAVCVATNWVVALQLVAWWL